MVANYFSEKDNPELKSKEGEFVERLLRWQRKHGRVFPWRKSRDLYVVLATEQMLRKTTAQQVSGIFERFFSRFGTAYDLAACPTNEIRKMILPLGMEHGRARVLKRFGKALAGMVRSPRTREELLKLPGIGEYAADTALCMIYGEDVPMVDRNVVRIIKRVFSLKTPRSQRREVRKVRQFAAKIVSRGRAKEFNFALLDFSALVCKARNPECVRCQMNDICDYGGILISETRVKTGKG